MGKETYTVPKSKQSPAQKKNNGGSNEFEKKYLNNEQREHFGLPPKAAGKGGKSKGW